MLLNYQIGSYNPSPSNASLNPSVRLDQIEIESQSGLKTYDYVPITPESLDRAKVLDKGAGKATNNKKTFNFTKTTEKHMNNPNRAVPVQTLKDAIANSKAYPDPQGTSSKMYYSTMYKNGKLYNLEVLYDKATNTIKHFKYSREAMGPLTEISK